MEVLNLIRLFRGWVFPYISRIHTAYIPGTQMTLVLIRKGLVLGVDLQNRGHLGQKFGDFSWQNIPIPP